MKELINISDVCNVYDNVYDNSNTEIIRNFKKRKDEYFYHSVKRWSYEDIVKLTDVENIMVYTII